MGKRNRYNALRWVARILGSILVVFTLLIFVGESMEKGPNPQPVSPVIVVIFIIWGIALAGLVVAFWKEGTGGLISIVSFILVYIVNLFNKEASMRGNLFPLIAFFSIPAILYLIYWKLNNDDLKKPEKKIT
jgi:hypothetical protein